jgi:hypothetical protein
MDEMGAQIAEKGGWSAGKRVQMVVFGEAIVMWEKGCLRQFLLLCQRKFFSSPGSKIRLGSMTNVTNDGVIFREGEFLEKVRNNFILI